MFADGTLADRIGHRTSIVAGCLILRVGFALRIRASASGMKSVATPDYVPATTARRTRQLRGLLVGSLSDARHPTLGA